MCVTIETMLIALQLIFLMRDRVQRLFLKRRKACDQILGHASIFKKVSCYGRTVSTTCSTASSLKAKGGRSRGKGSDRGAAQPVTMKLNTAYYFTDALATPKQAPGSLSKQQVAYRMELHTYIHNVRNYDGVLCNFEYECGDSSEHPDV